MSEFTISDMIDSANRASPSDFQTAFNDLLLSKIAAAIDSKRTEIAQDYFSSDEGEEETNTDNDNEETQDEDTETDSGNEEEREA